jgi:hypothetical protein
MTKGILEPRHPGHAPDRPTVPMGGSKNETLYLIIGILVIVLIALAFWFQATK